MTITEICRIFKLNINEITDKTIWDVMRAVVNHPELKLNSSEVRNAFKEHAKLNREFAEKIESSQIMNMKFLNESMMQKFIRDDYTPLPLRPDIDLKDPVPMRIVWFTRGWNDTDNKSRASDYYCVDYSVLSDDIRKHLIMFTATTKSKACAKNIGEIINIFSEYIESKRQLGIDIRSFYYNDGIALRELCKKQNGSYSEKKQFYLANLIRYLKDSCGFSVEQAFFKALKIQVTKKIEPEAVSPETMNKLEKTIRDNVQSEENADRNLIMYGVFLLLITTKIRLASIISLIESDIHVGDKANQYYITVKSKKSSGLKENMAISSLTYSILRKCLDISLKCNPNEPYICQWMSKGVVRRLTVQNFESYLKYCCEQAEIEYINPARIRKYYMTRAYDYASKNNFTDLDRTQITGHVSQNTTIDHYYDQSISRFIEGKYHITIGDPEILKRIDAKTQIGLEPLSSDYAVINELGFGSVTDANSTIVGFCRRNEDCKSGGLPCWCCKSFYTTPTQLPVFIAEMNRLQELRSMTTLNHEIQNIETQMSLVGTYITLLKTKLKEMHE